MAAKVNNMFLSLLMFGFFIEAALGGDLGVYWGQNSHDGALADACASGKYNLINIAYLSQYGKGRIPQLNLAPGLKLSSGDIINCHRNGVKVFLSIGGTGGQYSLSSKGDAKSVAEYLWGNFLGGKSMTSRPLGDTALDGIDFALESGAPAEFHGDLAGFLSAKNVLLSISPRCGILTWDDNTKAVISTGFFDYLSIRFYGSSACSYFPGFQNVMFQDWDKWVGFAKAGKILVGLPAAKEASEDGYVPPDELINVILPAVKKTSNYGGVVLWSKYYDDKTGYSKSVKADV